MEVAETKAETVVEEAQKGEEATSEVKEEKADKAVAEEEKPKTEETAPAS